MVDEIGKNLPGVFLILTHLGTAVRMGKGGDGIQVSCGKPLCPAGYGGGSAVYTADCGNDPDFVSYSCPAIFPAVAAEAGRIFRTGRIFTGFLKGRGGLVGIVQYVSQAGFQIRGMNP